VLLALSIGPFEVTRLRLAGDAASYHYGFSKVCGCRTGDRGGGMESLLGELLRNELRSEAVRPEVW